MAVRNSRDASEQASTAWWPLRPPAHGKPPAGSCTCNQASLPARTTTRGEQCSNALWCLVTTRPENMGSHHSHGMAAGKVTSRPHHTHHHCCNTDSLTVERWPHAHSCMLPSRLLSIKQICWQHAAQQMHGCTHSDTLCRALD